VPFRFEMGGAGRDRDGKPDCSEDVVVDLVREVLRCRLHQPPESQPRCPLPRPELFRRTGGERGSARVATSASRRRRTGDVPGRQWELGEARERERLQQEERNRSEFQQRFAVLVDKADETASTIWK
jgi:hypothetical protein